jgi:beta-galactosidase
MLNSTNNLYLSTEAGINRVAVRSTLTPGTITITATRAGLTAGTIKIDSKAMRISGGLEIELPQTMPGLSAAVK